MARTSWIPATGEPRYKVGDWVADPMYTHRPEFGRVNEVVWDSVFGGWHICIHVYSPAGNRGRFEPMLDEANWERIARPDFPLSVSRTSDWASQLEYLP